MDSSAVLTLETNLRTAMEAGKCHRCGCFQDAVLGLGRSALLKSLVPGLLEDAAARFEPRRYDCLGCEVCWPALASNAAAELDPLLADASHCATAEPVLRQGWPPLPGDYTVLRYGASVAVCTLNSEDLAKELAHAAPDGLAIVGTMHTENLGIERVIRNLLANPNIRFLVLCGDDTRQLVGHLPGQSMTSLFANGLDDERRIVGAKGKRPFVKNVSAEQVGVFKEQVQLVALIGEHEVARIVETVDELHGRRVPTFGGIVTEIAVETVRAKEPQFFKSDPAGFLVVYPDRQAQKLVVEHYTNAGVLDCVVEGATPAAVYVEVVKRGLVSQLDHAAYLGRELAHAERSLRTGEPYVQDRAPGEPMPHPAADPATSCGPACTTCK